MSNLFRSDPYQSLADGLTGAYVIGRVNIDGHTFHHLAFTEAKADWQLWVEPGKTPLPRRVEIVYKGQPGSPRVSIVPKPGSRFTAARPEPTFRTAAQT